MGKTKTSFVSEDKKPEKKKVQKKTDKVKISGLKGGQRVKAIEAPVEALNDSVSQESSASAKALADLRKPKVRSKKYLEAKAKIDSSKLYNLDDAVNLVKETSITKFDGTLEIHLVVKKIGLSANVKLPHTAGKEKKIEVASDETVKKLEQGKIDFDVLLATAEMMPKLVKFARILGPKGLMPNPKNGTLIKKASDAKAFSTSAVNVKTEREAPVMHLAVGKVKMADSEISENINTLLDTIGRKQILKAYLASTMGPSIKLQVQSA